MPPPAGDLGDGRDDHACQQAAVDDVVLGGFLVATHSNGISAVQLQSPLGLGSYRTAWMVCAKLRRAMVNPEREPLCGLVEADETIIPFRTKDDPVVLPAGRSAVGKMLVAGAVEVDGGVPRRARLKAIEGFGKDQIHAFVLGAVAPQTRLATDDWPSYQGIADIKHKAITLGPMAAHIVLPWTPSAVLQLEALGFGRLPRAAPQEPPALPRRVRLSLRSAAAPGTPPSPPCSASASAPPQPRTTC